VIAESQEIDETSSKIVADMDVDLQSQTVLTEYACTEDGCTTVFMTKFKLSYHLRNAHSGLIQPTWMEEESKGAQVCAGDQEVGVVTEVVADVDKDLGDANTDCDADLVDKDLNSSCDSVISGVTEMPVDDALADNPQNAEIVGSRASEPGPSGQQETNGEVELEIRTAPLPVESPKPSEPLVPGISRLSPESNKENKALNPPAATAADITEQEQKKHSALQDKNENRFFKSHRAAKAIDISRRKSLEARSATLAEGSSPTSSPKFSAPSPAAPWAKYHPSPSHASPSASILKRKFEGTPSSNEGSPLSGKRRHVHFNEDPVSESVEIPRTPTQPKFTRKKLKLSGLEQDIFSDNQFEQVYQETPPLDCSMEAIHPELIGCKTSIKNVILQLAATQTLVRWLDKDLKENNISTIGDLAALDPAKVRSISGIKPPEEKTVRTALTNFANKLKRDGKFGTWITPKSPVMEVTSKEEEEKIKEALFNGPSPSPTEQRSFNSPFKDGSPLNNGLNEPMDTVSPATSEQYIASLAKEAPLAMRAKRVSLNSPLKPIGFKFLERVVTPKTAKDTATPSPSATKDSLTPSTKTTKDAVDTSTKTTKDAVTPSTKDTVTPFTKDTVTPSTKATKDTVTPSTKVTKDSVTPSTKDTAASSTKTPNDFLTSSTMTSDVLGTSTKTSDVLGTSTKTSDGPATAFCVNTKDTVDPSKRDSVTPSPVITKAPESKTTTDVLPPAKDAEDKDGDNPVPSAQNSKEDSIKDLEKTATSDDVAALPSAGNATPKEDAAKLEDVVGRMCAKDLSALSRAELGILLGKTLETNKALSEFLGNISLALAKATH